MPNKKILSCALISAVMALNAAEAAPLEKHYVEIIEVRQVGETLPGKITFNEVASDEPDIIFCTIRKAGPHFLTLGNRLYLENETIPAKERIKGVRNHQFVMRTNPKELNFMPETNSSGWDEWVIKLNRAIADEWQSDLPGKQDVVLEIKHDGSISVLEAIAFAPQIDQNGKFVTETEKNGLQKLFYQSIVSALNRVAVTNPVNFPEGSTATSAIICASFNVDKNLDVWIPDLRRYRNVPRNERSLWIARICSLLDAGCLYEVSDVLRTELPVEARVRFVEANEFRSINAVGTACVDYGPLSQFILKPEAKDYLKTILKQYLAEHRYLEAELLAKRVSTDCFMRTACKGSIQSKPETHGTFSDHELDLQYIMEKKRMAESDFRKPVPAAKRFFI